MAGLFHQRALVAHLQSHEAMELGQEMGGALGVEVLSRELPLFLFVLSLGHFITESQAWRVHPPGLGTLLPPNYGLASPPASDTYRWSPRIPVPSSLADLKM